MKIRMIGAIAALGLLGLAGPASADHIGGAAHSQDNTAVASLRFTRNHRDGMGKHDYGRGCRSGCGVSEVPEPGMLVLFGMGLIGIGLVWRRRKKRSPDA